MIIILTFALFLFFGALVFWLDIDVTRWYHNKPILHKREWLFKAYTCVPSIIILGFDHHTWHWYLAAIATLMLAAWWWLLFDGFYNIRRVVGGKRVPWFFTGTNDPDDAVADNFLQGLKTWQHISLKIGLILLTTITYILCVILK